MPRNPLRMRSPELVLSILHIVYDTDKIGWAELLDLYSNAPYDWRTIEATIYDLVAYGALHRIGQPATRKRPDTRALKPTPLGRAWLEQELHPLPTPKEQT